MVYRKRAWTAILLLGAVMLLSWSGAWANAPVSDSRRGMLSGRPNGALRDVSQVTLQSDGHDDALVQDTHMVEYYPTEAKGGEGSLAVRQAPGQYRSLMRWDLVEGGVPVGAHIESAELEMYCNYRERDLDINVSIYEVLVQWDEASATWNQRQEGTSWSASGCGQSGADRAVAASAVTTLPSGAIPGWFSWDVTGLVQYWANEPSYNHGMLLLASGGLARCDLRSSEAGVPFAPKLTVRYSSEPATPTATATREGTPLPTATHTIGPSPTSSTTPTPTNTPAGEWLDIGNAEPAICQPYPGWQVLSDTRGKPNHATHYGALPWSFSGGEDVYVLQKSVEGDLTVRVDSVMGADLDVFLLYGPSPGDLLNTDDIQFTQRGLTPGRYYVVVDGLNGEEGSYQLSLICDGEPTPTATATNTPVNSFVPLLFRQPSPTPTITPTPTTAPTIVPYMMNVNCGGSVWYEDYSPDKVFTEGSWGWIGGQAGDVTDTALTIADTDDDYVFQWQRYAMDAYQFTVPNGRYRVVLQFAELAWWRMNSGDRVFSVALEGVKVVDNYDMLAAGVKYTAYSFENEVEVSDGQLDVTFEANSQYYGPVINGIRVLRIP